MPQSLSQGTEEAILGRTVYASMLRTASGKRVILEGVVGKGLRVEGRPCRCIHADTQRGGIGQLWTREQVEIQWTGFVPKVLSLSCLCRESSSCWG